MIVTTFFTPQVFTSYILKNKYTWFYLRGVNDIVAYKLSNFVRINHQARCTSIKMASPMGFFHRIDLLIQSYSSVNTALIKFKGKGYKLVKKTGGCDFLFNFSHMKYIAPQNTIFKKLTKSKLALISWRSPYLQSLASWVVSLRPFDMYSSNGLRCKRQTIYKRKGKTMST